MLTAKMPRDQRGSGTLVDAVAWMADREGLRRRTIAAHHRGQHRGRIDPAGKNGPDRNVRHQVALAGRLEDRAHFLDPFGIAPNLGLTIFGPPIAFEADLLGRPNRQDTARIERTHLLEYGSWAPDMPEGEKIGDCAVIDREIMLRKDPDRFQFRGEGDAAILLGYIERLYPERIPAERKGPLALVPDRDCEHSLEPPPGVVPPQNEGSEDRLGIGVRLERISVP